jgi:hypothetical protein
MLDGKFVIGLSTRGDPNRSVPEEHLMASAAQMNLAECVAYSCQREPHPEPHKAGIILSLA